MSFANDQVQCHSSYSYAQRPVSFNWKNIRYSVESIIAEWASPEGKTFRVFTDKEKTFELCYAFQAEAWVIKQL